MCERGREIDKRRNFDSLYARISFDPFRMHACNVIRVARLKLQRSAVISRRLQCRALLFRDISAAKNGRIKRLGAHRIKNNVELTPRVTNFFRTSFISGKARHRIYALTKTKFHEMFLSFLITAVLITRKTLRFYEQFHAKLSDFHFIKMRRINSYATRDSRVKNLSVYIIIITGASTLCIYSSAASREINIPGEVKLRHFC